MGNKCDLTAKRCKPCEGGVKPFGPVEVQRLIKELSGWEVAENRELRKRFSFPSFRAAREWINRVADLAEEEGHHPDLTWNYRKILITLTTHAIGGLSENDFILAAKIDRL